MYIWLVSDQWSKICQLIGVGESDLKNIRESDEPSQIGWTRVFQTTTLLSRFWPSKQSDDSDYQHDDPLHGTDAN